MLAADLQHVHAAHTAHRITASDKSPVSVEQCVGRTLVSDISCMLPVTSTDQLAMRLAKATVGRLHRCLERAAPERVISIVLWRRNARCGAYSWIDPEGGWQTDVTPPSRLETWKTSRLRCPRSLFEVHTTVDLIHVFHSALYHLFYWRSKHITFALDV